MAAPDSTGTAHVDDDRPLLWEPSLTFLRYSTLFLLVGSVTFVVVLRVVAPEQVLRAIMAASLAGVGVVAGLLLATGRSRAGFLAMAIGVWGHSTVSSVLFGGVNSVSAYIYPLPILLIGWLVHARAAFVLAIVTSAVTFALAVLEMQSVLPPAPVTSPILRWVAQACVFLLSATLIAYYSRAYRNRLADVRRLSDDLRARSQALEAREADLTRAQQVAQVGSWVYDAAADVVALSAEACRIFGAPERTAETREAFLSRLHPDDRDAVKSAWRAALAGSVALDQEFRILSSGRTRWVRQQAEVLFAQGGRPVRGVGTVQDVTERRLAEEALRASEMQLECILSSTSEGILAVDSHGTVVRTNRRFAEMWGIPQALLEARGDRALLAHVTSQLVDPDEFLRKVDALYQSNAESGDVVLFTDGRSFERFTAPLLLNGANAGRVWSFRDITERRRLEQTNLQAQKLASLGTLSGGIAHDFNNILAAIRGNADLAMDEVAGGRSPVESLQEIQQSTMRATELVRRIMTFGRPEEARAEPVDLDGVTREVLRLLRSTLPAGIELTTQFASPMPCVLADASQVHEAIVNLTTNAAHAIGPRPGVIIYRLEPIEVDEVMARSIPGLRAGSYVCLTVTDTGCGMDGVQQERIFDAFYTTKAVGEGTGLGLSMVHGIMRGHDGAVTVRSAPGTGSSFMLYFPAVDLPANGADARVPVPRAQHASRRVLFVDDEPSLTHIARRSLGRLGHTVTAFTDPVEALEAFRARPDAFDLVVTDLAMPQVSGIDLARAVLALRPDVPIVLTSGRVSDDQRAQAQDAGIREVLVKPFSPDELAHALQRVTH